MIAVQVRLEGVDEAIQALTRLDQALDLPALLDPTVNFLLERIRLNTPIRTGALRRSLQGTVQSGGKSKAQIVFSSSLSYAVRVHEELYQLGPVSQRQPPTEEGGVGNRFITRVLYYHKDLFLRDCAKRITIAVRRITSGGRVRILQSRRLSR